MKKVLIIDCGSNKTKDIISIVETNGFEAERWYLYYPSIDFKLKLNEYTNKVCLIKKVDEQVEIKEFDEVSLKEFHSIIFSGGGLLSNIQNEIQNYFNHLLQIEKPVLGICFGHQVIGLVHGANIYKLDTLITGDYKVDFLKEPEIIKEPKLIEQALFAKNHAESINLPKEFNLIAHSETCQNEMMQHQSKQIYGVQFHPEVSGKEGERIIQGFLKI